MVSAPQPSPLRTGSRVLSVLAVLSASVAAVALLFPNPLADVFFAGWVLFSVSLTFAGALGAWTNRTPLVWLAALLLTGLSIVGMWSIGFLIAPAALLLLGAALLSQWAGPRQGVQEEIIANPPNRRETLGKIVAGIGSVAVGGWLVDIGALGQELFGACARETLACALSKANWEGIGLTVLGLTAISFGGWLLWKQVYIVRVLASQHADRHRSKR